MSSQGADAPIQQIIDEMRKEARAWRGIDPINNRTARQLERFADALTAAHGGVDESEDAMTLEAKRIAIDEYRKKVERYLAMISEWERELGVPPACTFRASLTAAQGGDRPAVWGKCEKCDGADGDCGECLGTGRADAAQLELRRRLKEAEEHVAALTAAQGGARECQGDCVIRSATCKADCLGRTVAPSPALTAGLTGEPQHPESRVRQFIGWLSVDIPELHSVEVPLLADSWERFKQRMGASPAPASPPPQEGK